MARPAKPAALAAIDGSARVNPKRQKERKHKERTREEKFKRTLAKKPESNYPQPTALIMLKPEMVEIWMQVCSYLESLGTLSETDVPILELFVFNTHELRKCCEQLLRHGHYDQHNTVSRRSAESVNYEKLSNTQMKLMKDLQLSTTANGIADLNVVDIDPQLQEWLDSGDQQKIAMAQCILNGRNK